MIRLSLFLLLTVTTFCPAQEIALTFDDAPMEDGPFYSGNERTEKILKHLRENNVPQVAFFVITKSITMHDGLDRLKKYADAGHFLANHTHAHQWIHRMGTANYIRDIQVADSILSKMEGYVRWFRYPFLDEGRPKSTRDSIRTALNGLGLTNGYVTVDNYDWYLNGQVRSALNKNLKVDEDILQQVYIDHVWTSVLFYDAIAKKALGRSPKHVLLLHENDMTAKFLGALIKHIRAQGWKIISPSDAYKDPIAVQVPDVLFNGQGRVAAIAREKGMAAKDLVQQSEDEEYLDKLLNARKVFR